MIGTILQRSRSTAASGHAVGGLTTTLKESLQIGAYVAPA